jgi:hypothetical protein
MRGPSALLVAVFTAVAGVFHLTAIADAAA